MSFVFGKYKRSKQSQATRKYQKQKKENILFCRQILDELVASATNEYHIPSFIDQNEYERIQNHPLCVENENNTVNSVTLEGYRIVEIDYFLKKCLILQQKHMRHCTSGSLQLDSEIRKGISSTFILKCSGCHKSEHIQSEKVKVANKAIVWGTLSTGECYSHTEEMMSVLNIPIMTKRTFYKLQEELADHFKDDMYTEMEKVGKEEYSMAVEHGDIDADGIPFITVCVDGGWSKRSYGHSYTAASGTAVIIGQRTGEVLFVGVRNKYCSICAKSRNEETIEHRCFKNFQGSSASMEADILVEGFKNSISMHNLRYKKLIGDGDSNVLSKIRQHVSYGLQVEKIECVNHCIKNYTKRLYRIKSDTKCVSLAARKLMSPRKIVHLTRNVRTILKNNHGNITNVKDLIRNSIQCAFGKHEICEASGNCCGHNVDETGVLEESGLHPHLYSALNNLLVKTPQLLSFQTNNASESFMNILARFNMGKRLNLIQRSSFNTRSYLTGLRYNKGHQWHRSTWKRHFHSSPKLILKKYMNTKTKEAEQRRSKLRPKRIEFRSSSVSVPSKDNSYGPDISEIILTSDELNIETNNLLDRLQIEEYRQKEIEEVTRGQFENPLYLNERSNRLTASNFGEVVKRRESTLCHNLVSRILVHRTINSAAIDYGKQNEDVAISKFMENTGKNVTKCGLFISTEHGFLGASPDGKINDNEIIEVKCLHKVATLNITLEEAVKRKLVDCMEVCQTSKAVQLKRTHNYFYQIMGQLAITNAKICYFIVYTGDKNALYTETIHYDEHFWRNTMLPKLKWFYINCIAPNIIEDRPRRKLQCREPEKTANDERKRNIKRKRPSR